MKKRNISLIPWILGKKVKIIRRKFGKVFLSASWGFKSMQILNNKIFFQERSPRGRSKKTKKVDGEKTKGGGPRFAGNRKEHKRRTSAWRRNNGTKKEAKWFLGRLRESTFKQNVKLALKNRVPVLMICEKSLDVILFRSHFTSSIHKSKKLIAEGSLEIARKNSKRANNLSINGYPKRVGNHPGRYGVTPISSSGSGINKSGYRVTKGDVIRARRDLKSLRKVKESITLFSSMSWNYNKRLWKRLDTRWWVPTKQPWRIKRWKETIPHYKNGLPQLKLKIIEWLILPKDFLVDYKNLTLLVYKNKVLIETYSKLSIFRTNNFFKFKWKI